ncbi:ImmA/IrrE family metallo-endopeptidase [Metabacillus fastidiosus]|uniref:ImmA/IrrE family metallo-endopeptidase n=1 Tax=Metabacillus fastidiosus TaxID=1458 RepID=UPI0008267154|nr:ImmA/IrrE family metallo-endopeptidase [Metabacillus fastidiosus]MED4461816.1 ImmA/IrrE family metallo-endopeptidase [Metabacillus fastidiosus]
MGWIKALTTDLIKKYDTNNPYEIAASKNIHVCEYDLHEDILGFYKFIRRNKFIYINSNLSEDEKLYTCAHELGHAELHFKLNTPFLKKGTLLSIDKIEREANIFAVELLLPDKNLLDYQNTNLSIQQICEMHGIPKELSHLKKIL